MPGVVPSPLPPNNRGPVFPQLGVPSKNSGTTSKRLLARETASIVVLRLSQVKFACVWLVVLLLRCACASFLLAFSQIYSAFAGINMEYYARYLSSQPPSFFKVTSWICGVLGCLHCFRIIKMIGYSLHTRAFVFDRQDHKTAALLRKTHQWCSRRFFGRKQLIKIRRQPFDRQGCFGVESPYFEIRFLLQECFEMVSQTIQAYNSSVLIGQLWINHLYVAVVFINSWSTSVVQHFTRDYPALERILCFAADIILDAMMCIVLPLIIVTPYYQQFDTTLYTFPLTSLYDDTWFSNMVMESRQVFIHGPFDLIMKIMPHISIYGSLNSIEALVQPVHIKNSRQVGITPQPPSKQQQRREQNTFRKSDLLTSSQSKQQQNQPLTRKSVSGAKQEVVPRWSRYTLTTSFGPWLTERIMQMQRHRLQRRQAVVIHSFFLLWGLAVLLVHFLALYVTSSSFTASAANALGCKQRTFPWLANKIACSVFEYNCYRQGTTTLNATSLAFLDEASVVALILAHCPVLVVPQAITRFTNLLGFSIWNSTITEWAEEAGITQATHPSITYICLVNTNMTAIPDGLLSNDMPPTLQDIEITRCNITTLPTDLDTKWRFVKTLYMEFCQFSELPAVFTKMQITDLSLVGNQLNISPTITADAGGGGYYSLSLSNNPLTMLANEVGDTNGLSFLAVDNTQLKTFPDWVYMMARRESIVYAYNTSFCTSLNEHELTTKYNHEHGLTCSNVNPRISGRYPVEELRAIQMP